MRSTSSAISSTKKLPTKAVTAGIRNSAPVTMPSVAAIDSTQARICQAVCPPAVASAQVAPVVAIQENTRFSPMPISTIRMRPSPIDLSSTRRNGGENIWTSALMAASNIESSATGQRYVGSGVGSSGREERASVRRRNRGRDPTDINSAEALLGLG